MADQKNDVVALAAPAACQLESVNRIAKLPVVESTVNTVTSVYEKVKDYNSLTQMAFTTAETAVEKVVEVGKPIATPIVHSLEGPIKKVDGMVCTGLDYVESKVPAVKLPPGEILYQMYTTTKDYIHNTVTPVVERTYNIVEPAVKSAYEKVEPAVKTAYEKVEPAVESAKHALEPTYEKAKEMVEPYVQPALEKAQAFKEYGVHKVEEYLKCIHKHAENQLECDECRPATNPQQNSTESDEESEHDYHQQ